MLEIIRVTPLMCDCYKTMNNFIRGKCTKAEVMKRLMKEQKECYGALLETKKEKTRRLKRENSGEKRDEKFDGSRDSELSWMMKVSSHRLKIIHVSRDEKLAARTDSRTEGNSLISMISRNKKKVSGETEKLTLKSMEIESPKSLILRGCSKKHRNTYNLPRSQTKFFRKYSRADSTIPNNKSMEIGRTRFVQISRRKEVSPKFSEKRLAIKDEKKPNENWRTLRLTEVCKTFNPTDNFEKSKSLESRENSEVSRSKEKLQTLISEKPKTLRSEEKLKSSAEKSERVEFVEAGSSAMKNPVESARKIVTAAITAPRSILSNPKDILENIEKARPFGEGKVDRDDSSQSSEILSLSATNNRDILKLPSVTKILNITMDSKFKRTLELWMAKMINDIGQEAFDEYKRGLLDNSKLLHSSIECVLKKLPIDVPKNIKPCFQSIQPVLNRLKNVRAIESHVVHPYLGYHGVFDCVAEYNGDLCLIDWKKSDQQKSLLSATYDAPVQLASYIGALNADKNYPFEIKSGVLVIAYTSGLPPTVYQLDQEKLLFYWDKWLERLKKYYASQET